MRPALVIDANAVPVERQPPPADRLPTLTEVVSLGHQAGRGPQDVVDLPLSDAPDSGATPQVEASGVPVLDAGLSAASLLASALPGVAFESDTQAITQRVLAELGPRIDAMFEARLREALAPALAFAADGLIRRARDELTLVMRDVVQEAVARSLRPDHTD